MEPSVEAEMGVGRESHTDTPRTIVRTMKAENRRAEPESMP
jgi:hypothetical protein